MLPALPTFWLGVGRSVLSRFWPGDPVLHAESRNGAIMAAKIAQRVRLPGPASSPNTPMSTGTPRIGPPRRATMAFYRVLPAIERVCLPTGAGRSCHILQFPVCPGSGDSLWKQCQLTTDKVNFVTPGKRRFTLIALWACGDHSRQMADNCLP